MAKAVRWWLAFLFWETLALLIFQLVLGYATGSLTLIADSAHSSVDVVSYGLNYAIEAFKGRADAKAISAADVASAALVDRIDSVGAGLSVTALVLATVFVIKEAVQRLRTPPVIEEDENGIGPALFAFAVVSTLANLLALQLWRVAKRKTDNAPDAAMGKTDKLGFMVAHVQEAVELPLPPVPASEPAPAPPPVPESGWSRRGRRQKGTASWKFDALEEPPPGDTIGMAVVEPPPLNPSPLDSPPLDPPPSDPPSLDPPPLDAQPSDHAPVLMGSFGGDRSRKSRFLARHAGLNLKSSFAGGASLHCTVDGCTDTSCALPSGSDSTVSAASACADEGCGCAESGSVGSMLHTLVHPGCEGHGEGNLNATSALLHLVADVFRGIAIFITSLVIGFGAEVNAERADAICALAVAAFVIIGAGAVFQKLCATFSKRFGGEQAEVVEEQV